MDTDADVDPVARERRDYRAISHTCEGQVGEVRPLLAINDADAIAQTNALVRDLSMDLWDGLRFVEHFAGRLVATGCLVAAAGTLGSI